MGLLDDLKQQAESKKVEVQTNEAQKAQNLQAVNAALRGAFQYFTELANSLNILKPDVARSFFLDSSTRFEDFRQGNYRVRDRRKTVDHKDYLEEVALRFSWTGAQPPVIVKDTPMLIQRMRDSLTGYNLRFECKEFKNDRGAVEKAAFTIEPEIIASAEFAGSWESGNITLSLRNVETMGSVDFQYGTDELDATLFEELAKLVLGKSNNLRNLGRAQEMLRTTPRLRAAPPEVQYPSASPPPAPAAVARGSMLDSLKSIIKR